MGYVPASHFFPDFALFSSAPAAGVSLIIDATGEKVAFIGRVTYPDKTQSTKDISRVQFRFGAVTKAGGSGLTVSLQDVDATTGPPFQPDGTQDQTVAVANGNASFASNTWIRTDALSANRTVANGDLLAVVIEYDGSGRLGSDSVVVSSAAPTNTSILSGVGGCSLYTASWAVIGQYSNVLLEFSDGTFGTLEGGLVYSAITTATFNSGSTPDEAALRFMVPYDCKIDALMFGGYVAASATFDLVLYSGTNPLVTATLDANQFSANAAQRFYPVPIAEYELTRNTVYRLAVKPTTANTVSYTHFDVSSNSHLAVHSGGVECYYSSRTDAGSWSDTTTRRPLMAVRISSVAESASGTSGGVIGS